MTTLEESPHRIVVGIDGSECSVGALQWATRQAVLTESILEVVVAWEWPPSFGYGYMMPENYDPALDAHKMLEDAIEKIRGAALGVTIKPVVVEGHPAPALERASQGADLLVIGSHGHGAFAGMFLGSVGVYCTHHVSCPLTIVR
jgi:nucleotide-binding universal stress UspA family protein